LAIKPTTDHRGKVMDPFKPYQPKTKTPTPTLLTADSAEAVALQAIAFIAMDDELLARFIDDIRLRIGDRNFLTGVLDFILADEPTVLAFADHCHLPAELPLRARNVLFGDEG
jgi:Protein of unknown function (DUF3572)